MLSGLPADGQLVLIEQSIVPPWPSKMICHDALLFSGELNTMAPVEFIHWFNSACAGQGEPVGSLLVHRIVLVVLIHVTNCGAE